MISVMDWMIRACPAPGRDDAVSGRSQEGLKENFCYTKSKSFAKLGGDR